VPAAAGIGTLGVVGVVSTCTNTNLLVRIPLAVWLLVTEGRRVDASHRALLFARWVVHRTPDTIGGKCSAQRRRQQIIASFVTNGGLVKPHATQVRSAGHLGKVLGLARVYALAVCPETHGVCRTHSLRGVELHVVTAGFLTRAGVGIPSTVLIIVASKAHVVAVRTLHGAVAVLYSSLGPLARRASRARDGVHH
jgi:hypothetical protein